MNSLPEISLVQFGNLKIENAQIRDYAGVLIAADAVRCVYFETANGGSFYLEVVKNENMWRPNKVSHSAQPGLDKCPCCGKKIEYSGGCAAFEKELGELTEALLARLEIRVKAALRLRPFASGK